MFYVVSRWKCDSAGIARHWTFRAITRRCIRLIRWMAQSFLVPSRTVFVLELRLLFMRRICDFLLCGQRIFAVVLQLTIAVAYRRQFASSYGFALITKRNMVQSQIESNQRMECTAAIMATLLVWMAHEVRSRYNVMSIHAATPILLTLNVFHWRWWTQTVRQGVQSGERIERNEPWTNAHWSSFSCCSTAIETHWNARTTIELRFRAIVD